MANFFGMAVERRIFKDMGSGCGKLSTDFVGMFPLVWTAVAFGIVGGLVGWLSWGADSGVSRLVLLTLLPLGWGLAWSRLSAAMLMMGYFLAAARGLPGGTVLFFGYGTPVWAGVAFWVVACALLALPFVVLWSRGVVGRPWRFVAAVCVGVLPPLGLIGWVSPIAVAGILFPGLGWAGLALGLGVMMALVARSGKWVVVLAVMAVLANLIAVAGNVKAPAGWRGVDTRLSKLLNGDSDDAGRILAGKRRVEWVKQFAASVPANSVWVLPETVLGPYSGVSEFALMEVDEALSARGSRLLAGAELPQSDGRYLNAVVVLGAGDGEGRAAVQGIPMPVSMWKPWATNGAVADVFGHGGVVGVKGVRAGVLICYEQALTFSMLRMMWERPDVLVGVANVWWVSEPSIPAIQGQMLKTYGRLFGVGVVGAWNY